MFARTNFRGQFNKLVFTRCKFYGEFNFYNLIVLDVLGFDHSIFYNEAYFSREYQGMPSAGGYLRFVDKYSNFYVQHCNFSNSTFKEKIKFNSSKFYGKVFFDNTSFEKTVDFYGTEFHHPMNFYRTDFKGTVVFICAKFFKPVIFQYTNIYKNAIFRKAEFEDNVNFAYMNLVEGGYLETYGVNIGKNNNGFVAEKNYALDWDKIFKAKDNINGWEKESQNKTRSIMMSHRDAQETYRILKKECEHHYQSLELWSKDFFNKLILWFERSVSSYGTSAGMAIIIFLLFNIIIFTFCLDYLMLFDNYVLKGI